MVGQGGRGGGFNGLYPTDVVKILSDIGQLAHLLCSISLFVLLSERFTQRHVPPGDSESGPDAVTAPSTLLGSQSIHPSIHPDRQTDRQTDRLKNDGHFSVK